ncbi:MAG: glutamine amidotransferase [Phycisphaerae bacterium]|nr:glutamine amidotransferase [Phycisphaerae bacterium]
MSNRILYLGDTALDQAAGYLAGVMTYYRTDFDYVAPDERFGGSFLDGDYKAVVISDYPADNFAHSHLEAIAKKVKTGTGLLMIGGWDSFVGLNGKYNGTVLADVLPVIMSDNDDRINCSGPCLIVRTCSHKITDGLPFETNAPAIGGFNKLKVKQNCTEVLSSRQFKAVYNGTSFDFSEQQSSPLLVIGSFGNGNVAAFASDAAPHWVGPLVDWGDKRITAKADGGAEIEVGNWYARLLINIIHWISKESITEQGH